MKGLGPIALGGLARSKMQGTKVMLAGRTTFLPNDDVPIIVQKLTMKQIEAIPRDRFSVSLVSKSGPIVFASSEGGGHGGRLGRPGYGLARRKRPAAVKKSRLSGMSTWARRLQTPDIVEVGLSGTEFFTAIVTSVDKLKQNAESLFDENRRLASNQSGAPPQDSGLFYPPVNDWSMADCILKAIVHFFGEEDTCKIHGKEYKLAAFCLLMHDYFIRIRILRNVTRTPFCNYLLEYVLKDWKVTFTSRTFTNYANEYKGVERDFTEPGRLNINFKVHPEPSPKSLQNAFHEIGHFFHTSEYFNYLRDMRNNITEFGI